MGALEEVLDAEISGSDADREVNIVALTRDLDDVEPQEQDFDGDTFEIVEPALGDHTRDCGLVLERVGFYVEAAGSFKIHSELAAVSVQ